MIRKTGGRMRLCIVLLCLNLVFIWGNSMLSAELSGAISQWLRDVLAKLLGQGSADPDTGHGLLRKLAHFSEFCSLGFLLSWLWRMLSRKKWEHILLPLFSGAGAACIDELIQSFVPGRGPGIGDVGIDTLGVSAGILVMLLLRIYQNKKRLEKSKA